MDSRYNFTFIIPHRNIPELLRRCLASVPERDDIEVIVVDDASDDPALTRAAVGDFSNVGTVYADVRGGAGYARNIGLSRARGRWIIFADADDFFTGGLLPAIDSYRDSPYDIVFFDSVSASSDTLRPMPRRETSADRFRRSGDYGVLRYMSHVVWGKMFSRDFIERHHIRFDEVAACNDYMFAGLAGIYAGTICFDHRALYCYTVRSGSISTTVSPENCLSAFHTRLRYNDKLRECRVALKYWDNALSPFGDMLKICPRAVLPCLGTYLRRTPCRRIVRDFAQTSRRIAMRLLGLNRDRRSRASRRIIKTYGLL